MKVRADIAERLRAGLSDRAIERELGVPRNVIVRSRAALRIPKTPAGHFTGSTPQSMFRDRTEPADAGHLRWTGSTTNNGTPAFRWGGRNLSAYRVAFVMRHGRAPVGQVRPGCDVAGCVALGHVEDRPMRQRNRTAFAAIFGGSR